MKDLNKLMEIYSNDIPLLGALQELAQRRESELLPATKFLNNSLIQQWEHFISEIGEASHELVKVIDFNLIDSIPKAVEEIIDIQMSCETMLAILGLNKEERMESRRKVIEKNAKRGYYEPQQSSK